MTLRVRTLEASTTATTNDFENDNFQNVNLNGHDSPAADSAPNQGLDENPNPNGTNQQEDIWFWVGQADSETVSPRRHYIFEEALGMTENSASSLPVNFT